MALWVASARRAAFPASGRCDVAAANDSARRLYEKYGFTPVARRRGYYSDNGEDAVVMWVDNLGGAPYRELIAERSRALVGAGREG